MSYRTKSSSVTRHSPKSFSNIFRKRKREESPSKSSDPKKKTTQTIFEESDTTSGLGSMVEETRDNDCWLCHQLRCVQTCTICPRSFHSDCLEKAGMAMSETDSCPECQQDAVDGTRFITSLSTAEVKELLSVITVNRLRKSQYKHAVFWRWPTEFRNKIVNVVDWEVLIDKTQGDGLYFSTYTKPVEFFSDIKWIYHNCYILYGGDSLFTRDAECLVRDFKKDLIELEACPECFYHMFSSNSTECDSFVRICERPHDIVWAQVSGYPFWPAKALKVVNGSVHVRFFGKHEISTVPISQCYYISKEFPNRKKVPKSLNYNTAILELKKYVHLYESRFGKNSFVYFETRKPYKPGNAIQIAAISSISQPYIESARSCTPSQLAPLSIDCNARKEADHRECLPRYGIKTEYQACEPERRNISSSDCSVILDLQFSTDGTMHSESDISDAPTSLANPSVEINSSDISTTPVIAQAAPVKNFLCANNDSELTLNYEVQPEESQNNEMQDNNSEMSLRSSGVMIESVEQSGQLEGNEVSQTEQNSPNSEARSSSPPIEIVNVVQGISDLVTYTSAVEGSAYARLADIFSNDVDSNDDDLVITYDNTRVNGTLLTYFLRAILDPELMTNFMNTQNVDIHSFRRDVVTTLDAILMQLCVLFRIVPSSSLNNVTRGSELMKNSQKKVMHLNSARKNYCTNEQSYDGEVKEYLDTIKSIQDTVSEKNERNKVLENQLSGTRSNARLITKNLQLSLHRHWKTKVTGGKLKILDAREETLNKPSDDEQSSEDLQEVEHQEKVDTLTQNEHSTPEIIDETVQTCVSHVEVMERKKLEEHVEEGKKADMEKLKEIEKNRNAEIMEYKKNDYCCLCFKPANIRCCYNTNYCSKLCQKRDARQHSGVCMRESEVSKIREEVRRSLMKQNISKTQTISKQTSSIRIEIEQSTCDVIRTGSSTTVNMPLNLMTSHHQPYGLFPTPVTQSGLQRPSCSAQNRRHN